MKEIKSQGTVKKIAEIADISTWPVSTAKTAFEPGTVYSLGTLASTFSYTLSGAKQGAQWSFYFDTGSTIPQITHPSGVKVGDFKLKANCHFEVSLLQDEKGNRWLVAKAWNL